MHRDQEIYLRRFRKLSGLTQAEMAFLLRGHSGTRISRYERGARRPRMEAAFGYRVIYGAAAQELFARVCAEVEKAITSRARLLRKRIGSSSPDAIVRRKMQFLDELVARGR